MIPNKSSLRSFLLCFTLALSLPTFQAFGQPGTLDASFHPPADLRDIRSIVVQPDGRIIAAGDLDRDRGVAALARLNSDGSPDPSFKTGAGANNSIVRVALQSDGRILIGGAFTLYDGTVRPGIARLNADGSLDSSFVPAATVENGVAAIAVQADGKILIAGGSALVHETGPTQVARLNPDGSVDHSFSPAPLTDGGGGAPGAVLYDLLALPDYKVMIAGSFAFVGGVEQTGVAQLNPDGSRDAAFVPPFYTASVFALARQQDGFILTAGDFWATPAVGLARLMPSGGQDPNFEGGLCCAAEDPMVLSVVPQADGRILICGRNFHVGESPAQSGVVRLDAHGNPDLTFYSGSTLPAFGSYTSLALQDDGKVLVGGSFLGEGLVPLPGILRLNNDESPGFIKFASASYTADGTEAMATITVKRTGGNLGRVSVRDPTEPGTAHPGRDYQPRSGRLVFEQGEHVKTFTIPIRMGAKDAESEETVRLLLGQPSGGAELGTPNEAVLTIASLPGEPEISLPFIRRAR